MLICGLTGVLLEFGQYYLARGRSFELADMLANAFGAIAGALTAWKGPILLKRIGYK